MVATVATVGVPPATATAPPLTRMLPAALRVMAIVLSRLSPKTLNTPVLGRNEAVTAGTTRASSDSSDGVNRVGRFGVAARRWAPRSMALNNARSIERSPGGGMRVGGDSGACRAGRDVLREPGILDPTGDGTANWC